MIAQIDALLYLTPLPLSLDDIVAEFDVSKAAVNIIIRQPQSWSAVEHVCVKDNRRDSYKAETDWRCLTRQLDTTGPLLSKGEVSLQQALANSPVDRREDVQVVAECIRNAKQFYGKIKDLLRACFRNHFCGRVFASPLQA